MSDSNSNPPVGDNSAPGGNEQNQDTQPKKDTVAYETYQKVLSEKKKQAEKLAILEAEKNERDRKELEAKGEYQKLIELEKKRADEAALKVQEFENQIATARKVKALLGALGGQVDEKFYDFLPIDQIAVDPETKEISLTSVAKVAEDFKKQYPELLKSSNGPRLPANAPTGGPQMITEDEWKKLPGKKMREYKPSQILWNSN